jgi:hypothetical protein
MPEDDPQAGGDRADRRPHHDRAPAAVLTARRGATARGRGTPSEIAPPNGARPISMMIAAPSKSAASIDRARKARNAADATKNARSENIVALAGPKT